MHDEPQRDSHPTKNSATPTDHKDTRKAGISSSETDTLADTKEHRAKEREHWVRTNKIARDLNRITIISSFVSIIALGILYGTLIQTRRQANIAFAQTRPWVTVQPTIDGDVVTQENNTLINVGFNLQNVGHAPALDVDVEFEVRPIPPAPVPKQELPLGCQIAKKIPKVERGHWMPPESTYDIHHVTMVVNNHIITAALNGKLSGFSDAFQFLVIGCAIYRIEGESSMRQTPFGYIMYRWVSEHPGAITFFRYRIGAVFGAESLRLSEYAGLQDEPN